MIKKKISFYAMFGMAVLFLSLATISGRAQALSSPPGAHTFRRNSTDDVFLGGNYLELGISKLGSFGTTYGYIPNNFYGPNLNSPEYPSPTIAILTNPTGFGVAPDLRMDFTAPGSPEEGWAVGYTAEDSQMTGSNALLMGRNDIPNNYVYITGSTGSVVGASSQGTFNSALLVTQNISFKVNDKYFKNIVTLKNVAGYSLDSVRYMRNMDPDNTVYQGGTYATHNSILYTFAAGDKAAAVVADTTNNSSDPVFQINGTNSPFTLYSPDSRARVSTFGFSNDNPYNPSAYDSVPAKGYSVNDDIAISITVDVGTLAPNASSSFTYYTIVDNRNPVTSINDIRCGADTCR